jgi:hypothetical protein
MALDATRTINGSYGEVWHDGIWQTNIQSAEAVVDIDKEEIKRSGTRWTGHKVTSLKGSGNIKGYKITSDFIQLIGSVASDRSKPYVTSIILKLADPEAYGAERVMLKGVQFDQIPLSKFEVGSLVEEELPFTFSGYDLLDKIKM